MWIGSKLTFMPGPARTAVSLMISACTCALCRLCVTVRARHRRAAAMEMPALPCSTPTPLPGLHPSRPINPRERYNSSSCRSAALLSCGRTMRSDCSTRRPQSRNARAPRTLCVHARVHTQAREGKRARAQTTDTRRRDPDRPRTRAGCSDVQQATRAAALTLATCSGRGFGYASAKLDCTTHAPPSNMPNSARHSPPPAAMEAAHLIASVFPMATAMS